MMVRKQVLERVSVTGLADRGKAVGRDLDGNVVFVEDTVPGDLLDVVITRKKKGYYHGKPLKFIEFSAARQQPPCIHFEDCGGCKWQHFNYRNQLIEKDKMVKDAFERIGKIKVENAESIIPAPDEFHYRNKMEFSFSNQRWKTKAEIAEVEEIPDHNALGLHPPGFYNKVVDLSECLLMQDPANDIRNFIKNFSASKKWTFYDPVKHTGFLRNMILRNSTLGDWMLVVSFGYEDTEKRTELLDAVMGEFPIINSLHYVVNAKKNDTLFDQQIICYHGSPFIQEKLGKWTFKIRPKSFFQTNSRQAERLYNIVKELASLNRSDVVYDLYTGTGSIAQFVAEDCQLIVGIEEIEDAIKDAKENALNNQIGNAHFEIGDVKRMFSEQLFQEYGYPNVVITDPPRGGMHEQVVESLLRTRPEKIVYISCNPATQARDINLLAREYRVSKIQPVDMFPHTSHIENVALLIRRNEK